MACDVIVPDFMYMVHHTIRLSHYRTVHVRVKSVDFTTNSKIVFGILFKLVDRIIPRPGTARLGFSVFRYMFGKNFTFKLCLTFHCYLTWIMLGAGWEFLTLKATVTSLSIVVQNTFQY